jgi:phosphatidate cytidylyltransferase
MPDKKKSGLASRLLTAAILIPLTAILMWGDGLHGAFCVFVATLAGVGLYEYFAIARARGIAPETWNGIVGGTAVALSGYFGRPVATAMVLYASVLLIGATYLGSRHRSIAGAAASVFGVLYVGWFGAHLNLMHADPEHGAGLVTLLFVAVILTDSAAYFVGSRFGRHKMAPAISPNKSWEGAAGGAVFSLLGMAILYYLRESLGWDALPDRELGWYLTVGVVLSIVAQLGDFVESALKRDAGVKDSGVLFPGHGGVLDRCDGFLFAAPILYYIAIPAIA